MNAHQFINRVGIAALAGAGLILTVACGSPAGANLDGTWQSPCYQSAQTRLTYSNLMLTGQYLEYSDMACTTQRHISTWTGSASVGEEVNPGVHKLDLAFTGFRSKPLTAAEAAYVNQGSYCGISDWAAGVERDVLGRNCYNFSIPAGGQSLDLYMVDGNTLTLGKGSKISAQLSEADRPTELDPTRPFARQ